MKKNVWILNHYATDMGNDRGGRHYYFAEKLKKEGYEPVIICASSVHKSDKNFIEDSKKIKIKYYENVPFIFLKTNNYTGNGRDRIKNMFQYFWQVLRNYKKIEEVFGKPDVIIGSSVHPLACLAALIIGKKYKIKKIIEIRDLWPETLLMMGIVKEKTLLSWLLYKGEKYLYKKADNIIFTMEGGKQYIIDKGWEKDIDLSKIYHINNGVDLARFRELEKNSFIDKDLDSDKFKVIYTGTIAKFNNLEKIIKVFERLDNDKNIVFLIYGDGEDKVRLENYCKEKELSNIKFKGRVSKSKIPWILSKADLLLLNYINEDKNKKYSIFRYGVSFNKLFEYLASGNLILQTMDNDYNLLKQNAVGRVLKDDCSIEEIKDEILNLKNLSIDKKKENYIKSQNLIEKYDFKNLTSKLIKIIEK